MAINIPSFRINIEEEDYADEDWSYTYMFVPVDLKSKDCKNFYKINIDAGDLSQVSRVSLLGHVLTPTALPIEFWKSFLEMIFEQEAKIVN